jgi:ATP-dependent RNA helicase DDX49/DBP8
MPSKRREEDDIVEEGVDQEYESGSQGGSGSEEYSDNSGSDSDSLDSTNSRKRRKLSPAPAPALDDDDDDEEVPLPKISVPSRIVPSRVKASTSASKPQPKPQSPTVEIKEQTNGALLAPVDTSSDFASLGLKPWLVRSLESMAIRRPTGIQKGCIPEILKGRDCIGGSRTGSGKTVAFAVPMLQKWSQDPFGIYGLILTPTRELALQIYEQVKAISSPQSLKAILVTGGTDMRPQALALASRPHIVIATPGRLADHIRTSGEDTVVGLKRCKVVVLDEADRLLNAHGPGSMLPDVSECLSALPPPSDRQTLLFTATVTPEVRALKDMPRSANKPELFICEIDAGSNLALPAGLNQTHLPVPVTHREHYLHELLLTEHNVAKSVIIFCNRTVTADYLTHLLRLLDHRVTALHSKLPQRQRTDNLARFRASAARILVATDVAARGLDIPEVGLVINYDVPRDPDDYIHRVGRTARAGRKGTSVTLVGQRDVALVKAIEDRVGREMVAWEEEGVNLETRVVREGLKLVGEKKREAWMEIEEGREVGGKRRRGMVKLKPGKK